MSDAKIALIKAIDRENDKTLHEKGLELEYKQCWSTSWLELSVMSEDRRNEVAQKNLLEVRKCVDNMNAMFQGATDSLTTDYSDKV